MKIVFTFAVLLCSLFSMSGQEIAPSSFYMAESSVGAPKYFPTTFTNSASAPLRLRGVFCNGYADVDLQFLRASDSSSIENFFVLPGDDLALVVRITPKSRTPMTLGCNLELQDTNGVNSFGGGLSLSGTVAKESIVKSVAPTADFGNIGAGTGASATIVLKNTGNGVAHYKAIEEPSMPFSIVDNKIWIVNPSDSVVITVAFEPTTMGQFIDTVVFGQAHIYTASPIRVVLQGSVGPVESGLTTQTSEYRFTTDPPLRTSASLDIEFTATSEVTVSAIKLSGGNDFSFVPHALPLTVSATSPLVVRVTWTPSGINDFEDTLIVTTAQGNKASVLLRGAILTGVESDGMDCKPHPNPTVGSMQWCSVALEHWYVVNGVGEIVSRVVADEQGTCRSNTNLPGAYTLVSGRTGKGIPFVVLR